MKLHPLLITDSAAEVCIGDTGESTHTEAFRADSEPWRPTSEFRLLHHRLPLKFPQHAGIALDDSRSKKFRPQWHSVWEREKRDLHNAGTTISKYFLNRCFASCGIPKTAPAESLLFRQWGGGRNEVSRTALHATLPVPFRPGETDWSTLPSPGSSALDRRKRLAITIAEQPCDRF